jgi:hypothetical protein
LRRGDFEVSAALADRAGRLSVWLGVAALTGLGAVATDAVALPSGWEPPRTLSRPGVVALEPWTAANARGDLVVAWRARLPRGGEGVQVALRRAGATAWSPPLNLGPRAALTGGVRATLGPQGRALVAWYEGSGGAAPVTRVQAALLPPGARRIAITTLGTARSRLPRFVDPPAVALTGSGRAVVAWTAKGPASVNDRVTPLGRVVAAVSSPAGVFRAPRRLDDRPRPASEGGCASDSGPGLATTRGGGVLAWWDCDDDIRDFEVSAALADRAGRFGKVERTGAIGRGSNGTALAPRAGGAVVGVWTEDDSSDLGRHLRSLVRSPGGRWRDGHVPVAPAFIDDPLDEFSLPYARYPAAIADAQGGGYVAAWVSPFNGGRSDDRVWAASGPDGARLFAPSSPVGPPAPRAVLAGVGVTRAGTAVVAWAQRASAQRTGRALWAATRAASGSGAFGPAEEAELVGDLVGKPHLALGAAGGGAVAWSRGPRAAAAVRASALRLP